jgi:hypothetical protein
MEARSPPIVLKNPRNVLAPNSRICAATLGIGANYALEAQRTVTGREDRLLAGSPSNFRRSRCVASRIVIDPKIRVFQHNPPKPEVQTDPLLSGFDFSFPLSALFPLN